MALARYEIYRGKNLRVYGLSSSVNYICNRYTAFYILDCEICPWIPGHISSNWSYHLILSKFCRFPNSRFWSFRTRPNIKSINHWSLNLTCNMTHHLWFIEPWTYLGICGADMGDLLSVWIWGKTNFELISSLFNWQPAPFIVNKVSSVKSRVRLRSRNLPGDRIRPILYPRGICFSGAFTYVLIFKCKFKSSNS